MRRIAIVGSVSWLVAAWLGSLLMVYVSRTGSEASVTRVEEKVVDSLVHQETPAERVLRSAGIPVPEGGLARGLVDVTELKDVTLVPSRRVDGSVLSLELEVREKAHRAGARDRFVVLLHITNRSDVPVAYRVLTRPFVTRVECRTGGPMRYHAFLLRAGESTVRREGCAPSRSVRVKVLFAQVLKLNPAAYALLARLREPIGLDARLSAGHRALSTPLSPCVVPMRYDLDRAISSSPALWFGVMRFYATHDCATEHFRP